MCNSKHSAKKEEVNCKQSSMSFNIGVGEKKTRFTTLKVMSAKNTLNSTISQYVLGGVG